MLEIQYFDECPNAAQALKNIRELIYEGLINEELKVIEITDASEAKDLNFQGSPTLLLNGKDIYTERIPISYNYSCRVYTINGKRTGVLEKEYILKQIQKLK